MAKKASVYIAIGLIIIGLGIAFTGMSMKSFSFDSISSEPPYEEKTYDVTEDFDNIDLSVGSADIEILLSDDDDTHFICYENDNKTHDVTVEGDTLIIKEKQLKKLQIGFYFGNENKSKLYLPKDEYDEFIINVGSGDLAFDSFSFASVNAEVGSGAITIRNCEVSGDACFDIGSGKVIIENFTCDNGSFKAGSGDYELTNMICSGNLDLEVSSGDVEMDKCDADNMSISASSGTIEGTVLSKFDYEISVASGDTKVPDNGNDGTCKIKVGSGDVRIELAK
ncbi:MAG: DUF4097 domain-containing protein [Lachnospiraceae bacterium]|nr:DUF4097 domain-containing protein [Lachnospiraceae bacterium]